MEGINKLWLKKAINRARTHSRRWGKTFEVHHCIKGRGKESIKAIEKGEWGYFWNGSVSEILFIYKNGTRLYEKGRWGKSRTKIW